MNKLARAYGDLLMKEDWSYFSTLTYKWNVKPKANRINMDRLASSLNVIDKRYTMFWAAEWHTTGISLHNHLLVKGDITQDIDRFWTSNRLSDKKFISHIKYEKDKGANFYVSKYLDKNIDYDYIWKN
ncbi:hypothetical protein OAJ56_01400 [Flavobacteriales bacterium]|nr:hypothetical protein [Flavobacteriales bacterium]MDC0201877.1 hypothetical protein [Flavobacteriales bacterium]